MQRWHVPCVVLGMWKKFKRLFVIKTKLEAGLIIYALGLGAMERGLHYVAEYPGPGGWLLLLACTGSVFLAGAKIFDCIRMENAVAFADRDLAHRRREFELAPVIDADWLEFEKWSATNSRANPPAM